MAISNSRKRYGLWSCVLGNVLDHYDGSIYSFLAIYLAKDYFSEQDPIVILVKAYSVAFLSLICRPLGALWFSKFATSRGVKISFVVSLFGVGFFTFMIAMIPSYQYIGVFSVILLVLVRGGQAFFAAGEHAISGLYIITFARDQEDTRRISGYYQSSSVFGIVLASLVAFIISMLPDPHLYWRFAFIIGGVTSVIGLVVRITSNIDDHAMDTIKQPSVYKAIQTNKLYAFKLMLAGSFSYITYSMSIVFMNNFVPLVTSIKYSTMMSLNTVLLVGDMLLLLIIPRFAPSNLDRFLGINALIFSILCFTVLVSIPHTNSIAIVVFLRILLVLPSVAFSSVLYAWAFRKFSGPKYLLFGISYTLGYEILGKQSTTICLWLLHKAGYLAPAIYIAIIGTIISIVLLRHSSETNGHNIL